MYVLKRYDGGLPAAHAEAADTRCGTLGISVRPFCSSLSCVRSDAQSSPACCLGISGGSAERPGRFGECIA